MPLSFKEKELANIGASVATGCKPCTDYHFDKVREAGATDDEIKQAISDAMAVRDCAREIMENHGLKHLGIVRAEEARKPQAETTRMSELVSLAAAFAVNCTTSVREHMAAARALGVTDAEIRSILDAARFIKGEAAHYVGQIVKLKEEKDRLQQLLEELERTQAQLVQSEKMAALGKLVAGIVHEMNTPIGTLNSATDTVNRSVSQILEELEENNSFNRAKDTRRFQSAVKALRESDPATAAASKRITKIVGSLKAFAHLDGASFQRADLHEGLENTLTLLEHEFKNRIRIEREYGELPLVPCSPGEVNQVFMHLLQNAAEAISDAGTITIRTREREGYVFVEIADTGSGISPAARKRLFEPAFAKKGSRMKAGLGLFTSANIIQKHNGRIDVESEVGKGSTFTIVLPNELAQPMDSTEPAENTERCNRMQ